MRNKDSLLSGPFFTLQNLISGGIKEKISEIEKVHREAVSESKMEKEIEMIRSEWECTELSLKPFGENRARVVLTQSEEMLLMIEKHLDKIYQMRKFEQINEVLLLVFKKQFYFKNFYSSKYFHFKKFKIL